LAADYLDLYLIHWPIAFSTQGGGKKIFLRVFFCGAGQKKGGKGGRGGGGDFHLHDVPLSQDLGSMARFEFKRDLPSILVLKISIKPQTYWRS